MPIPQGWTELEWIPDRSYGFSAGVYKKGNEIVIAFAGTNGAADCGWAGLIVAGGGPSPQVMEAMLLYVTTKRENPGAIITFTGHSLGGGLASMMSVFFDRPSTAFITRRLRWGFATSPRWASTRRCFQSPDGYVASTGQR